MRVVAQTGHADKCVGLFGTRGRESVLNKLSGSVQLYSFPGLQVPITMGDALMLQRRGDKEILEP
uniref:Uncharacterized protein n=1 Tax=Arundo donax TaxID=35708 RepID=A0A0A9BEK6_ARUDO